MRDVAIAWIITLAILFIFFAGVKIGENHARNAGDTAGGSVGVSSVETPEEHVGTIQECNRVELLRCLACHEFPVAVVKISPEIWEE